MMDNIKKQFFLRKEEIVITLVVGFIAMLIGVVGFAVNRQFDSMIDKTFEIGAIATIMVSLMLIFFINVGRFGTNFNYAVSMGRTRKSFLISYMVVTLIHITIVSMIASLIGLIESIVYKMIYSGTEFEFQVMDKITPAILIMVVLAELILPMFIGAIIMKFGLKSVWIFWGITMVFNLLPDKLISTYINQGKLAFLMPVKDFFFGIRPIAWFALGYIFLLIILWGTTVMVKKQSVNV